MASGFVQRFKGKVTFQSLWYKGFNTTGFEFHGSTDGVLGTTLGFNAVTRIMSTGSSKSFFFLPPPQVGMERWLNVISSVAVSVQFFASTGSYFDVGWSNGSTTFGSTNTIMLTTVPISINIIGESTVAWMVAGVYSTSTGAGAAGINPSYSQSSS